MFFHRDGAKSVVPGEQPLTVGRAWPADVVVDDRSVSREHARFRLGPDGTVAFSAAGHVANPAPAVDPAIDYTERKRREMQRYETQLIVEALARAGGNVTAAAQALKIPVRTLTHKMQQLGIKKRHDVG